MVPFSTVATTILYPVMMGGIAYALDAQRRTRTFGLREVLAGFGPAFVSLVAIGCVSVLSSIILFAVLNSMSGPEAALAIAFNASEVTTLPPNFMEAMLLSAVVSLPVGAATFLAAPLVMLHGMSAGRAMKMSFFGCVKNIVPWVLCVILMFVIVIASAIPLLLGLFVTVPAAVLMFYPIYRDIFIQSEGTAT